MTVQRTAVVTGASRGAGRGIAVALGAAGYRVYVTGRTRPGDTAPLPGTIDATAREVSEAGGEGIPCAVDHADDTQVAAFFDKVARESGTLDVLVNNACFIHEDLAAPGGFWEKPAGLAGILDVGLRSHYLSSWHAARIMVPQGRGLIAFTSSFGGVCYMHGPAYGAQKAGTDKMAADMAVDFRDTGVAAVSIWMGPLATERTAAVAEHSDEYAAFMAQAETPGFTGRLVAALYDDPALASLSGQTLIGAELAERYAITEEGGRQPPSYRAMLGDPRVPSQAIVR
ncbi:MAG: SDR family NAD(P)-dependent oxidoreductase [Novosphingobium sp.]|nr:SDR family NAD(P)-dependent oxidoreductase [Novosphingobium sp.]